MPRKIFDSFYRDLCRDIYNNCTIGEKYISIREIAVKFAVSVQTAQKAIQRLESEGLVDSRPKAGIYIKSKSAQAGSLVGKTITVLSNKQDPHFYYGFFQGVVEKAYATGINVTFLQNSYPNTQEYGFGEYLLSLETDGLIALSFRNSGLPFYHAMSKGLDIVSDIIIDDLPILPAIQTNNFLHSQYAGEYLLAQGKKNLVVLGYYPPQNNRRYAGFTDVVEKKTKAVKYIQLSQMDAISEISAILQQKSVFTGYFLSDYASSHVFAALCQQRGIYPDEKSLIAYDGDGETFSAGNYTNIPTAAPSFKVLGAALCGLLIHKWQFGSFPSPLLRKI